mgnify:CR=1 FL=1
MTWLSISKMFIIALLIQPLSAAIAEEPPQSPGADLEVVEKDRRSEVRAAQGIDWNAYTRVKLDRASVEFRKNWVRDQRQRSGNIIREDDEKRIKDDLSDLFEEVLTRELVTEGGYTMAEENGQGVLHFIPRIVNLDIIAPDRVRDYVGSAFTDSQGRMTIEMEIRDSLSGDLLATTRHYEEDPHKGYMEWTTSATNRRSARLMLMRWAEGLRERLDEMRGISN